MAALPASPQASTNILGGPVARSHAQPFSRSYYFEVTDPSGQYLLSTDDVSNRRVTVGATGYFVSYNGTHLQAPGKCPGVITVQLMPYLDTPNPGGEYKAWVVPVQDCPPTSGQYS